MALTRLAPRGDLSQLRWARWQNARSFDAHSLNAYGVDSRHGHKRFELDEKQPRRAVVLISRIRLKNWRNFRELDVPLRDVSYLLGPNASGKSNLLDVFRFLRDVSKPRGGGLQTCLLYTSDAADEEESVDLGGRR